MLALYFNNTPMRAENTEKSPIFQILGKAGMFLLTETF
jgi:hypothetical protein